MDIIINRTQFIFLARPGQSLNPGTCALKSSALPIEITMQNPGSYPNGYILTTYRDVKG